MNVDFSRLSGKIKPMNAVNNGPTRGGVRGETPFFTNYKSAKIPYARLHDSAFFTGYGGDMSVDVHRIFRNFDADENNPDSYIFKPTDDYLSNIDAAGTKIFYRLGAAIEHYFKFGTVPPKDYLKWARICEHIILHYTEGWANGFKYDIEYWEIWNEPDCLNADGSNPCWQGTLEEFCEFYSVVSKYLKSKFPHLKIGGPAVCTIWRDGFTDMFLQKVKDSGAVLDFFSYHVYGATVENMKETIDKANSVLERNGFLGVETILNEWNYNDGWLDEKYTESLKTIKNLKGSSFLTGVMCVGQSSNVDMLMYYDARPSGFNGFNMESEKPLKSYYSIKAFSEIADLENNVPIQTELSNVYAVASTDGKQGAVLLTYFDNEKKQGEKRIKIDFNSAKFGDKVKVEYYLIDEANDLTLTREEIFSGERFSSYLNVELYSTYLIKIKPE